MDGYIYTYAKGAAFRGLTLAGNPFAELPMEA